MANIQNPLELNPTVGGKQYAAGISKSKMQSLVDEVNKVGDKYEKPAGGIPSSDLSSAVQGSLAKADESAGEEYVIDEINAVYNYYGDPTRLNQLDDWGDIADEATLRSRLRNVLNLSQAHTQRISFNVGGKTGFAIVTYNGEEFYVEYTLGSNRYACKQDANQSGGWTPWQGSTELETYEHLTDLDTRCNVQEVAIFALNERKADVEGSYESMAVGSAKTLEANTLTAVDFTKRVVPSSVGSGASKLSLLKGNTLVWNQMSESLRNTQLNVNGVSFVYDENGKCVISGTSTSAGGRNISLISNRLSIIKEHKYLIHSPIDQSHVAFFSKGASLMEFRVANHFAVGIFSRESTDNVTFGFNTADSSTYTGDGYFQIFDLTRMFGAGNEPSSVEEFEALFPRENYASATPWLMNFQGTGLKSTGFNVWDEEWESGYYNMSGAPSVEASSIRSKNYCACLPNSTYYVKGVEQKTVILFYDENYTLIQRTAIWNATIVSPAAARYFKLSLYKYGPTYYHDICINISDPAKNGTYMPYMEDTLPLNVTTLKGKAEGSYTEVVMFPDGLKKAGNVYDEIDFKNGIAIKRVGSVDLGTLNYTQVTLTSDEKAFSTGDQITDGYHTGSGRAAGLVCPKYEIYNSIVGNNNDIGDKYLWQRYASSSLRVFIHDSSYTDVATFKAAMQGVMLNYELATPIIYHFEPLNNVYRVEQGGTEEVENRDTITPEGYAPSTAPMRADIRYGVDVVGILGNLKKDYVSKESIQVFLSALGTQMGGTWSMTWNETTERYDFVFTPNA